MEEPDKGSMMIRMVELVNVSSSTGSTG